MANEPLRTRFKNAWNILTNRDPTNEYRKDAIESFDRPDRLRYRGGNDTSLISSIFTRIGVDASSVKLVHSRVDRNGTFQETIDSSLNHCLTLEPNIDQTGRFFLQDVVMSLCDEGSVAIVAVDTDTDPDLTDKYKVLSFRTGRITKWHPSAVTVNVYNDRTGNREDVRIQKTNVAIIENPFYQVMNEPLSTTRRLTRKLNLLDAIDEQSGSGKLDLLVQLPYVVRSLARQKIAEQRRIQLDDQLKNSKFGIGYIDASEKIIQLNRPVENQLMGQIEFLTKMLYGQLSISEAIINGTASDKEMLNYYAATIDPIISAIADGIKRTYISRAAIAQGQSITMFRDPFKLVPVSALAEIGDKFTRNEIMTSNEVRGIIGLRPSSDPEADKLRNKNLN